MSSTALFDRATPDPVDGDAVTEPPPLAERGEPDRRATVEVGPALSRAGRRLAAVPWTGWVSLAVVAGCAWFVFHSAHPGLVLRENTPTGGDMGAHVWGPMYLMHHVLSNFRLTGWSPDWYAGFPAYQFYMVVPSLLVVALNVGIRNLLVVPAVLAAAAVAVSGWVVPRLHRGRRVLLGAGLVMAVLVVPVPYGVAFKLITVSGLVSLPVAAWAFGRLSGLAFPGPPVLAVASLFFIYNREPTLNGGTGNIIGGNMASTMAGEFAFSISLSLCVLYLGFLVNGLRTGRHRAVAAVLLALTGLCHLIPAFFALGVTFLALAVWPGRARLRWALPTLPVAGLLSAFWVVPFLLRHAYVNDMGWEKLPSPGATDAAGAPQDIWDYLAPQALWWPLALAAVGLVVAVVYRYRPGLLLAAATAVSAAAFVWIPQARLWNARVLPFFFLSLFLLAGVGVAEVLRSLATLLARDPERPGPVVGAVGAVGCLAFALVFLGVPLGRLPGATYPTTGGVTWMGLHRTYRNDVPGWAKWNYEGLEGKPVTGPGAKVPEGQGGWPEYRAMVATMARLGRDPDHGCGRAFWEYGDRLESYGTPMAPMLLPYFTDSCIGSMEGLYFESSATTPYHFLSQCELSDKGSCAQRDLAYRSFDLDLGLRQLGLMGVKYYMAFTDRAVQAAAAHPSLTEVAVSGPWHVYQLPAADSALVTPLEYQPVVMDGVDETQPQWLDPAVAWYMDPERWSVPLAADGPDGWARVRVPEVPVEQADGTKRAIGNRPLPEVPQRAVEPARVTNITSGDDRLSFDVDQVGRPVLVKVSYFPNWQVSGGEGPYRVTPNLMVVVPTSTHVSLHYGRTPVDWLAIVLTLAGLAGLVLLARRPAVTMPEPRRRPVPTVPDGAVPYQLDELRTNAPQPVDPDRGAPPPSPWGDRPPGVPSTPPSPVPSTSPSPPDPPVG